MSKKDVEAAALKGATGDVGGRKGVHTSAEREREREREGERERGTHREPEFAERERDRERIHDRSAVDEVRDDKVRETDSG